MDDQPKTFLNVWDALCPTPEDAREMDLKSALFEAIQKELKGRGLTAKEAAGLLQLSKKEVRLIAGGCPDFGSIGRMIVVAGALGLGVSLDIERPKLSVTEMKARVIARGKVSTQRLLKEVPMMSSKETRNLLGISDKALKKMIADSAILAVPRPSNRNLFPAFQFTDNGHLVAGFKTVMDALPSNNPVSALHFFATPVDLLDLERSIDVLRWGKINEVVWVAKNMFEQGV